MARATRRRDRGPRRSSTRGRRAGRHVARAFCARRAGLAARRLGRRGRCRGDRGRHPRVPLRAQSADGPGRGRASHRHPAHGLPARRRRRRPPLNRRSSSPISGASRRPRPGPQGQRRPGLAPGRPRHAGRQVLARRPRPRPGDRRSPLPPRRARPAGGAVRPNAKPPRSRSVPSRDGPAPGRGPGRWSRPRCTSTSWMGDPVDGFERFAELLGSRDDELSTRHRGRPPRAGCPRGRGHVGPLLSRRSPAHRSTPAGVARSPPPRPLRCASGTRRPGRRTPVGGRARTRSWGGHRRRMAGGGPELGPRDPPPRRGVLPVARRAGRPARRPGDGRSAPSQEGRADAREHVPLSQAIAATRAAHPDQTKDGSLLHEQGSVRVGAGQGQGPGAPRGARSRSHCPASRKSIRLRVPLPAGRALRSRILGVPYSSPKS